MGSMRSKLIIYVNHTIYQNLFVLYSIDVLLNYVSTTMSSRTISAQVFGSNNKFMMQLKVDNIKIVRGHICLISHFIHFNETSVFFCVHSYLLYR